MRMYKIVLMSIVLILGFNFTVEAQSNPVVIARWSPDAQYIALMYEDGMLEIIDSATRNSLFTYMLTHSRYTQLQWSPDGTMLAVGLHEVLMLWGNFENFPQQAPQFEFSSNSHVNNVDTIVWSPDSSQLITLDLDGLMISWNLSTGVPLWTSGLPDSRSLSWGCNGTNVLTVVYRYIMRINPVDGTRQILFDDRVDPFSYISCNPDEIRVALGSDFGQINIYDISGSTLVHLKEFVVSTGRFIISVSWSYTGQYVAAVSSGGVITIWDTLNEVQVDRLNVGEGVVPVVDWSPIDNVFVYGGEDSTGQIVHPNLNRPIPSTLP